MEATLIEKLIETLAKLRNVAVADIKGELADDNVETHEQLFKIACAWKACA